VFQIAKSAALEAGNVIAQAWTSPRSIQFKSERDLVTEIDMKCEALIIFKIKQKVGK
jgi:fructose-1,6-bisphosphatase/inositol monophosphatase family enzyme